MREAGDRTTWTDARRGLRGAVHAAVDAAFDDRDGARRARRAGRAGSPAPGWSNALAAKLVALTCPACPTSTRAASCGSTPWSTPTTGGRSTSTRAPSCWPSSTGPPTPLRTVDDAGAAKLLVTHRALRLRRDRPELFTTYAAADGAGRPPTTWSRSTAAARSPSPPGCRSARRARRLGRHDRSTCRDGTWRDVLTGRSDGSRRRRGCGRRAAGALSGRAAAGEGRRDELGARSTSGRRRPSGCGCRSATRSSR